MNIEDRFRRIEQEASLRLPNVREYFYSLLKWGDMTPAEMDKITKDGWLIDRSVEQDRLGMAEYRRQRILTAQLESRLKEISPPKLPDFDDGPLGPERRQNPDAKLVMGLGWILPDNDPHARERAILQNRLQLSRAQVKKYQKVFEEAGRDFFGALMALPELPAVVAR